MSNTYTLTKKIHELLPQVKAKYGLKFEVESDYTWVEEQYNEKKPVANIIYYDDLFSRKLFTKLCPAIQAPQLRQILFGLKEVLEVVEPNPITLVRAATKSYRKRVKNVDFAEIPGLYINGYSHALVDTQPKTQNQAETLWLKWFNPDFKNDGLSLFDREPLPVLQEVKELLLNLLK